MKITRSINGLSEKSELRYRQNQIMMNLYNWDGSKRSIKPNLTKEEVKELKDELNEISSRKKEIATQNARDKFKLAISKNLKLINEGKEVSYKEIIGNPHSYAHLEAMVDDTADDLLNKKYNLSDLYSIEAFDDGSRGTDATRQVYLTNKNGEVLSSKKAHINRYYYI